MKQWQDLIRQVMTYGADSGDRTGVGTRSVFGTMARWNLKEGFPATTTKSLAFKACIGELLWFLEGSTNVERLRERTHGKGVQKPTIWDLNYENQGKALGYEDGELGPVYGKQWRDFGGVDQLVNTIDNIKNLPKNLAPGRRLIVSAWNPAEIPQMALPPCHVLYQFEVMNGKLSLLWYQRSVDLFLGLPFDIASYATLLHLVARMTGYEVGDLVFQGGNTHVYFNHFDQVNTVLSRDPHKAPTLEITGLPENFSSLPTYGQLGTIHGLSPENFKLIDYTNDGVIKAPMAV